MSPVALADSPRAQDLRGLTIGEKLEWALLRRRRGNALFEEGKYVEATDVYMQSLLGMDMTGNEEQKQASIHQLQVPVCNNLAAIKLMRKVGGAAHQRTRRGAAPTLGHVVQEWLAAVKMCDQVRGTLSSGCCVSPSPSTRWRGRSLRLILPT